MALSDYFGGKMVYDPDQKHRRSIRLPGYDYSQPGAYFITIVAYHRIKNFGEIKNGQMEFSPIGRIIAATWSRIPMQFTSIRLGTWILMPDHLHAIIELVDPYGNLTPLKTSRNPSKSLPNGTVPRSLPAVIQNFKSVSTRKVNEFQNTPGSPVWQRNYYEHIIRNETEMEKIEEYIENNPFQIVDEDYWRNW